MEKRYTLIRNHAGCNEYAGISREHGHWSLVIGHWSLVIGHWEKIVVQGGRLGQFPSSYAYVESGIWFYCFNQWVEMSATEYRPDQFWLSIFVIDDAPVPEPSKHYRPPRQLITTFPDNCRLDKMSTDGVKEIVSKDLVHSDGTVVTEKPLVLRCHSGDEFEIIASEKYPANIEIQSV